MLPVAISLIRTDLRTYSVVFLGWFGPRGLASIILGLLVIVEEPEPDGPFGAKGVGEVGLVPVPAAIANAIRDAVGIRPRALPMTPERNLRAMLESDDAA